jgi:translation initiation factor IF-2
MTGPGHVGGAKPSRAAPGPGCREQRQATSSAGAGDKGHAARERGPSALGPDRARASAPCRARAPWPGRGATPCAGRGPCRGVGAPRWVASGRPRSEPAAPGCTARQRRASGGLHREPRWDGRRERATPRRTGGVGHAARGQGGPRAQGGGERARRAGGHAGPHRTRRRAPQPRHGRERAAPNRAPPREAGGRAELGGRHGRRDQGRRGGEEEVEGLTATRRGSSGRARGRRGRCGGEREKDRASWGRGR